MASVVWHVCSRYGGKCGMVWQVWCGGVWCGKCGMVACGVVACGVACGVGVCVAYIFNVYVKKRCK